MTSFGEHIATRKSAGLYRQMRIHDPAHIDFYSNDYLGYARLLGEGLISAGHNPEGATGSRLLSGNHDVHEETEAILAAYFGSASALLVHSGYQANLTVLSSVASRHDIFLYDAMVHASIHDGMRLSHAQRYSFRHNDLDDLESKLIKHIHRENVFVVCESLYSMSGNILDIDRLMQLQKRFEFTLILDEAHAAGVLGAAHKGLGFDHPGSFPGMIRVVTFGKAFGYTGAAILCDPETRDYLINFSRPFIYTTAPPLNTARTIADIIHYHAAHTGEHERLTSCIQQFILQSADALLGVSMTRHRGPIQYITLDNPAHIPDISDRLTSAGLALRAIRPPTVPAGMAGFRICLHAFNTAQETALILQPHLWASQNQEA